MKYGKQRTSLPWIVPPFCYFILVNDNHLGQKPGCSLCPLSVDHLHSILAQMFPSWNNSPSTSIPSLPPLNLLFFRSQYRWDFGYVFQSPFLTPKCTVDASPSYICALCVARLTHIASRLKLRLPGFKMQLSCFSWLCELDSLSQIPSVRWR